MDRDEILAAINAFLEEPEGYDPAQPGFDRLSANTAPPPPEPPAPKVALVGYRKGRLVQPSDRRNTEKNAWLTEPPPTRPRRPPATTPPPPRPTLEPVRVYGPAPPPPILVEVAPRITVDVPHFAVHVSRQYKARLGNRRWHLRFDRVGRLRSCKEKSYAPTAVAIYPL